MEDRSRRLTPILGDAYFFFAAFHLAHRARCAAAIFARADADIFDLRLPTLAALTPPSPERASIAFSVRSSWIFKRLACLLSCEIMPLVFMLCLYHGSEALSSVVSITDGS